MNAGFSLQPMRRYFTVLLVLALLLGPALTRLGTAYAAVPHHSQMMEQTGDCHVPPCSSADHDKSAGKTCCISTCIAVRIDAFALVGEEPIKRPPSSFPITSFHIGFLGEIATPPPRSAREPML